MARADGVLRAVWVRDGGDDRRQRCAPGSKREPRAAPKTKTDRGARRDTVKIRRNTVIPHGPEHHPRHQHVWISRPLPDIPAGNAALLADRCRQSHRIFWRGSAGLNRLRLDRRPVFAEACVERVVALDSRCSAGGFFRESFADAVLTREILTCIYGVTRAAAGLYVNLAGYHVKALRINLSGRGSGMFVTSLYGGAAFGGYLMGFLANRSGWLMAGEIQMTLLCTIGAVLQLWRLR